MKFLIGAAIVLSLAACAELAEFGGRGTAASAYSVQQSVCLKKETHEERVACIDRVRVLWADDSGVVDAGGDQ